MLEFKSTAIYDGPKPLSGKIYEVEAPYDYTRDMPPFLNQTVIIDGMECFVSGVESYALGRIRKGMPIGLWVKSPANSP